MTQDNLNNPDIIDRIYDVAVDPTRLEQLVDVWEERFAPMRLQGTVFDDSRDTTYSHFSRMGLFLDRLEFSDPQDIINEVSAAGSLAAIAVSANLTVQQLNAAATTLFGLEVGDKFSGISPELDSQDALNKTIYHAINNPNAEPEFLRFRLAGNERFIVVRVHGLEPPRSHSTDDLPTKPNHELTTKFNLKNNIGQHHERLALVVTTELSWQPSFGQAIQNAFDLTSSEVEIVRALVEGFSVEAIAAQRGRSIATVRTQIRSIFEKTETRSQAELVRISLSLMDMVNFTEETAAKGPEDLFEKPSLKPTAFHSISRPNNRRLDHVILGDPDGAPMLYFPGDYGLIRWTASAESYAKKRGIKVVVPIRAGYGKSTKLPKKINFEDETAADFAALLDHHGIDSCPVMTQSSDFYMATIFAARHPHRVSSIIGLAPALPLWKREQFERMDKWYKFINANARFAPRILPYLVKAGFYLALSIGQTGFMNAIYSNSQADQDTYADPEVFEALITGSNIVLSKDFTAHEVFAREVIISSSPDWVSDLEKLKGKIPIHAFLGSNSPMVPAKTLAEYQEKFDWIQFHIKPDAAELIFFKYWQDILDFTHPFLPSKTK